MYLEKLNYNFEKKIKLVGQIQVLKAKKNFLYFDTGEPPIFKYSKDYQSGPLSFEYFNNESKIITNCGYGRRISKKTKLISKFTSAQSTLCLNDTSVVKFQKSNLINKAYGPATSDTFKTFDIVRNENKTEYFLTATHNAYLNKYGYLHRREIKVLKKDGTILGTDTLVKKKEFSENIKFSIRFHIYPGINVVKTVGGRSILLQVNKNKSWILLSDNHSLEIETGLFMGRNKVLNNSCVVIYGNTNNKDANIKWELKKSV